MLESQRLLLFELNLATFKYRRRVYTVPVDKWHPLLNVVQVGNSEILYFNFNIYYGTFPIAGELVSENIAFLGNLK
jgi:hypothetical protein